MAEFIFEFKRGDIIDADTQFIIMSKIPTEIIADNLLEQERVIKDTTVIIRIED
jgi:hypothetical protein